MTGRVRRAAAASAAEKVARVTHDLAEDEGAFDDDEGEADADADGDEDEDEIAVAKSTRHRSLASNTRGLRRSGQSELSGNDMVEGPRKSRAKRAVVEDSGSDDENEDDDDDDAEGDEDEDAAADEDDEEDADAEGEEDVDMTDMPPATHPPPPIIQRTGPASAPRVTVVSSAPSGKMRSVEEQELLDDDDDDNDDLSEAPSDPNPPDGEEDAEGEEVDEDEPMEGVDDDEEDDDDGDDDMSRGSTPDVSKMTKRQRSRVEDTLGNDFLQLPMEPQIKKHLTAEEHALRRAEMARRRKNLSEKRNEEEKWDTINRLLKKQAPKRRGKVSAAEMAAANGDAATPDVDEDAGDDEQDKLAVPRARAEFTRWISTKDGCRLGVPQEWKEAGVGRVFGNQGWIVEEAS